MPLNDFGQRQSRSQLMRLNAGPPLAGIPRTAGPVSQARFSRQRPRLRAEPDNLTIHDAQGLAPRTSDSMRRFGRKRPDELKQGLGDSDG